MKKIIELCDEIFEEKEGVILSDGEIEVFKENLDEVISDEYWYVLKNYSDIYIREEYGFRGIQKSPLAIKGKYERISKFISSKGKENIEYIIKMYHKQIPIDFFPIGFKDGGNLLCVDKKTGYIYIWIHDDVEGQNIYLVEKSFQNFMNSFEKIILDEDDITDTISCELLEDFFDYL